MRVRQRRVALGALLGAIAALAPLSARAAAGQSCPPLLVAGAVAGEAAPLPGFAAVPFPGPFADIRLTGPYAAGQAIPDGSALAGQETGGVAPEGPVAGDAAPELVGPDDDRLLHDVEQRATIAPADADAIPLSEPTYDIPLEINAKVLDYIELFQTTRRHNFEAGLVRSRKFEALMKPIFLEAGVPSDLFYLALIESGFNPKAYSYAHAMGIWQFISSTGRIYGLRRTSWVDERCDPVKATRAAARHMRDLYDELGSWPLVLAAYNAGKGRVGRAIAKAGTTDFWSLPLPAQTRNYVPAYFAALLIAKDPPSYGFLPEYEDAPEVEAITIGGGTRLSLVAALCGTSTDEIRALNPELRTGNVPPGGSYELRIPAGTSPALVAGLAKVPAGRATSGITSYRIAAGDTLAAIARRFGTSVEELRESNGLRGDFIRAGEHLLIPGAEVAEAPIPRAPGRVVVSSTVPASYRVRRGDNPWAISQRYGVALADLLAWNDLNEGSTLRIGQTLALRGPGQASAATARRGKGTTYEVRRGDNLWQISRRFDTSVEALQRANGLAAPHTLRVGDLLTIP